VAVFISLHYTLLSVYLVMSTTLKVFVVSPDTHSERRFDAHTTIGQLKVAYSLSYAMITQTKNSDFTLTIPPAEHVWISRKN